MYWENDCVCYKGGSLYQGFFPYIYWRRVVVPQVDHFPILGQFAYVSYFQVE